MSEEDYPTPRVSNGFYRAVLLFALPIAALFWGGLILLMLWLLH